MLLAVAIKLYCFKLSLMLERQTFCFSIVGSNSGSGCRSGGIWGEAEFLCRVVAACGVSGESGIGRLGYCAFVFPLSCGICVCGIMFDWGGAGGCGVAMSVLPGFLALGWSVSGVVFSRSSRSFIWAWLCFRPEVPFKEGDVMANCFQMFRLVVLYFQMY